MQWPRGNRSLPLRRQFIHTVSVSRFNSRRNSPLLPNAGKANTGVGFPYPDNVALASLLESVVRTNGGVPATVGILGGVARVGLSADELIEVAATAETKSALKVSRRDLGYICGLVSCNKERQECMS